MIPDTIPELIPYMANIEILLCDARGQYIPRDFATDIKIERFDGIDPSDVDILASGPDHPAYWNVWDEVCSRASYTHPDGRRFTLYQDGDLFLICPSAMSDDEYFEFFGDHRD